MMQSLMPKQQQALTELLHALIDQEKARILIHPHQPAPGFWFGGGNLVPDSAGTLWLCGRYRNYGDSRTGLQAGERGLECAIFRSTDNGQTFEKVHSWSKADLSRPERLVLSIEGTALHQLEDGAWELFVSSEKDMAYPDGLKQYQKPGTGVWTIDRLHGSTLAELDANTLETVLENDHRPEYLHLKDPVIIDNVHGEIGETVLIFCSHPHVWSSSNSGYAVRPSSTAPFELRDWEMVSRGATWDVAATRITGHLSVPQIGQFADLPPCSIYFYDGAECLRDHDENKQAHKRPRGYSCEEISGAFSGFDDQFPAMTRLSSLAPLFVSPWGTGCSRYAEALLTDEGIFAIWEQSQPDASQPLVGHFLSMAEVTRILA